MAKAKNTATAKEVKELMEVLGEDVSEKEINTVLKGNKKEKVEVVNEDRKVEQEQQQVKTLDSKQAKEKYKPILKPSMLEGKFFSYHLSNEGVKFYEVNSREEFISKEVILEQVEALKIWDSYYGIN